VIIHLADIDGVVVIETKQSRESGERSLKIPKGKSESVYRRRTDNLMAKKRTKGQTTYK
jgi:regulator of RNase E activity RraA